MIINILKKEIITIFIKNKLHIMTSKKLKIILIIIFSLLISLLIFIVVTYKEKPFEKINFKSYHYVTNKTNTSYLDTIVHSGLEVLNIDTVYIIIKNLPELKKDNEIDKDLEFHAFILGNEKQYVIYIKSGNRLENISILSHELVHLKQYYTKRLIPTENDSIVIWEGKKMNVLDYKYNDRPWESEAFSSQEDVSKKMKEILYKK